MLPREHLLLAQVPRVFAEVTGVPVENIEVRKLNETGSPDLSLKLERQSCVIELQCAGDARSVGRAIEVLKRHVGKAAPRAIPVVVVPYMGQVGQELCERAGVHWLDLSGNARIFAPGLRVHILGQSNRFKRSGRPPNLFAPKSARITRLLLLNTQSSFTQREIAQLTHVDAGFTSRIVRNLEQEALIRCDEHGAFRVRDPDLLLDAWREAYEFNRHTILRGHVVTRSSDELTRRLANELKGSKVEYAATGLAAAWLLCPYAGFRTVTFYLREYPGEQLLGELGFREVDQGSNVWLVVPNDTAVFEGSLEAGGVRCVAPVQVYLDLQGHPERAKEAAAELRLRLLRWRRDG